MDESKKHHHFLISGEVVFVRNEEISSLRMNGILISDRQDLPVRSLGKAQQVLQVQFHKQMAEHMAGVQIVDVLLHNFVHLGHFTKEEFNAAPEGMAVQPKEFTRPELKVVPAANGENNG
jgi:hypothetical protein